MRITFNSSHIILFGIKLIFFFTEYAADYYNYLHTKIKEGTMMK